MIGAVETIKINRKKQILEIEYYGDVEPHVYHLDDQELGNLLTPVILLLTKRLGLTPTEFAQIVEEQL